MRRLLAGVMLGVTWLTAVFPTVSFAANGSPQGPKLLNLYLDQQIPDAAPAKLAKWDIVVLDVDQQFLAPEKILEMKRLNPNIKILAYVSASEIADARFQEDPNAPAAQLAAAIPDAWFLHRANGTRATWWPGAYLLNVTDEGPTVNGQRWNTFLGPFIREHVMSSGLWDGVFLDGAYGEVTSHFGTNLDPDDDGQADPPAQTDEHWYAGMRTLIQRVRDAIGNDKLIMSNSSSAYADLVNGVLFENFPRYGWAGPFAELRASLDANQPPKISAINTNTNNQETPADYRLMRYGLASALIADGYFSFDAGDSGHSRTWWYDEYDANLGRPIAPPVNSSGVWSRRYDHGLVLLNASAQPVSVPLGGTYQKIVGLQDPGTNTGEVTDRVTLPPQDGLILLNRDYAADIQGQSFVNGVFYQVYDGQGRQTRPGFFALRDDIPKGAIVLAADLDGDGTQDLAYSINGIVTVRFARGGQTSFMPFGPDYRGGIDLAVNPSSPASSRLSLAPTMIGARTVAADLSHDGQIATLVPVR